jgi:hypothetical protein
MYNWRDESSQVKHFYRLLDGKILGTVWQYVNNNIVWCSKILEDEFPFTDANEKYLGHFIDQDSAKKSVEKFWKRQDNIVPEDIQKITMR